MKFKFLPVYPSDVQNSFTETHAIDVCPTPAVIATNTSFFRIRTRCNDSEFSYE